MHQENEQLKKKALALDNIIEVAKDRTLLEIGKLVKRNVKTAELRSSQVAVKNDMK